MRRRLSRKVLALQIEAGLHQRQGKAVKPVPGMPDTEVDIISHMNLELCSEVVYFQR